MLPPKKFSQGSASGRGRGRGRGRGTGSGAGNDIPRGSAYTVIYNQQKETLVGQKKLFSDWFDRTSMAGNARCVANNPGQHVYPGGGLHDGRGGYAVEDPTVDAQVRQAAIREWCEETGLIVNTNASGAVNGILFPAAIHTAMAAAGYDTSLIPIVNQTISKILPAGTGGRHCGVLNLEISDMRMVDIVEAFRQIEFLDSNAAVTAKIRKDDELANYTIIPSAAASVIFAAEHMQPHPHAHIAPRRFTSDRMDTSWFADMANNIPGSLGPALTALQLEAAATTAQNPAILTMVATHPNTSATALTAVVHNIHCDIASDRAVIDNLNTLDADLASIASRTLSNTDLHKIADHQNRGPVSMAAMKDNPCYLNVNTDGTATAHPPSPSSPMLLFMGPASIKPKPILPATGIKTSPPDPRRNSPDPPSKKPRT